MAIAQADGIAPLVALVRDGTEGQKVQAAAALGELAFNNAENRVAIAQAGGIAPLVALVRDGTDEQKVLGCRCVVGSSRLTTRRTKVRSRRQVGSRRWWRWCVTARSGRRCRLPLR